MYLDHRNSVRRVNLNITNSSRYLKFFCLKSNVLGNYSYTLDVISCAVYESLENVYDQVSFLFRLQLLKDPSHPQCFARIE